MEILREEELKAHLMQTDEKFKELSTKHAEYDRVLTQLESKSHLSPDEMVEEVRLKKLKLQTKDQMHQILSTHKH
jgi:hypothetical protein